MKLETFQDVVAAIEKNKTRPFHLMVGNGFSIAYDPKIFSYNALYDFVESLKDDTLTKLFGVVNTKNFELIMRQLETFSNFLDAFGADAALKNTVEEARSKLKSALIDAVKALHPEHVFKVPEAASKSCATFLRRFLDSGGKLFTSNYDLLLYWVLMRNQIPNAIDGFGLDLLNPDEGIPPDEQEWSELRWGKYRDTQTVYYLHGALPLFDSGVDIEKEVYDAQNYLLQKISGRMNQGHYPIFVTAGDGREKLTQIMHNRYLTHCYEALTGIEGSLVTFGFNFGDYDHHIIDAINSASRQKIAKRLRSIYIGVFSADDQKRIESIQGKFRCKLHIFDAKTTNVWK
jgi:hypothetical protein